MDSDKQKLLPILKDVTVFTGLKDSWLQRILTEGTIRKYVTDDVLMREGTPATDILIVLEGEVKIVLSIDSDPLEICRFGPGSCVGEMSVIGILDHSASVIAVAPTTVLVVSRQLLLDISQSDRELFSMLILNTARELARRLQHTDEILLHYTRLHQFDNPSN